MMTLETERIRRLRAGNAEALASILNEHWEGLVCHAQGLLDNRDDAEDAVQEAFVRFWIRRKGLSETGALKSLLHRIVRNVAVDVLRSPRRKGSSVDPTELHAPLTPDLEMEAVEFEAAAREAVESLPPRRREVFRLVRESGLSYQEVADILELSRQTVANQMSLALSDLRVVLHGHLEIGSAKPAPEVEPREKNNEEER